MSSLRYLPRAATATLFFLLSLLMAGCISPPPPLPPFQPPPNLPPVSLNPNPSPTLIIPEKDEIRLYHFNGGNWPDMRFLYPDGTFASDFHPVEGISLTQEQCTKLKRAISTDHPVPGSHVIEFRPRHAFVFFEKGQITQCIEVCVICSRAMLVKPGKPDRQEITMNESVFKALSATPKEPRQPRSKR